MMCDKDVCDMCVRCVVGGGGWAEEAEAGGALKNKNPTKLWGTSVRDFRNFSKLATSKTKQFCEFASKMES